MTLDAEHIKYVNLYSKKENILEHEIKKLKNYKKEYNLLSSKMDSKCTGLEIQRKYYLEREIDKLNIDTLNTTNGSDESKYYLKVSDILMDYFEIYNKNKTDDYKYDYPYEYDNKKESNTESKVTRILDFIHNTNKIDKKKLYDKFRKLTDVNYDEFVYNVELMCEICGVEKTIIQSEGRMVCSVCGISENIIIDSEKPSYREHVQENSYFCYKRINHFNEWLSQFQAKESTEIPKNVYNLILKETKKMRIIDLRVLNQSKMKEILKKLGLNKYYEHIPHIINKLNGVPPPILSRKIENKMRLMFIEIQLVFQQVCPPTRRNFLSYSYVLYKICELLELDEFLHCFTLLKSREKLNVQDKIWNDICQILGYQYIPST